ncbi:YdcF family protein [Neisseria sicca]|jgi:putative periplasmic protein|uniref:YdcF family protein n=1 Tax=Neisseria sicca TaxID=490 RepID=UPI0008A240B5|nr:YdcF family protein [Neisseria sicca]MBS5836323.1 YdcF family protein [Neisseria sp.]OFJ57798.1 SanA protein [Neisseria sp. HMSC073B07]
MLKKNLVFILVLFFTAALLPLWIMWRDFQVSRLDADTVRPADAAVVLSTRAYEEGRLNPCLVARVEAAVELYRAGKVKKLVMTGGVSRDLQSSAGNMQMIAEKMGVPKGDIIQEREAGNTFENIVFSRKFIENSPRVVIVSAGFHLARARMMADKQWQGHDIQVYAAPFCSEPYGGYGFTVLRESAAFVKNALKGRL